MALLSMLGGGEGFDSGYVDPATYDTMSVDDPTVYDAPDFDIMSLIAETTRELAPGYQPPAGGYVEAFGGATDASGVITAGGVATSLKDDLKEDSIWTGLKRTWASFDKTEKGIAGTLGASLLKGIFGYGQEDRKTKVSEKMADASMLNAQTNAAALQAKTDQIAGSQIAGTTFGAKQPGLIYQSRRKVDPLIRTGAA